MSSRHYLHVFPGFNQSGPQLRTASLARSFGPEIRHSVVSMDGQTDAADFFPPDIELRLLEAPQGGSLSGTLAFRRILAREKPDLLLTYNFGSLDAVIAARTMGRPPHVHHEEGFSEDEVAQQKLRRVLARRFLLRGAAGVVVCSRNLERIAAETWKLPMNRVTHIANGIQTENFANGDGMAIRQELGIPEDALVVGSVAHLRPVKNLKRLIRALSHIPKMEQEVHLVLVGDGSELESLRKIGSECPPPGGRVHLPGHQTRLRDFYAAMDIFSLSSDSEQQPIALLEASSSGLPMASTNVGDIRHMIAPEQLEFLVSAREPEATDHLTNALARLLEDEGLRKRLGEKNLAHVNENFSYENMVESYRTVYSRALETGTQHLSR